MLDTSQPPVPDTCKLVHLVHISPKRVLRQMSSHSSSRGSLASCPSSAIDVDDTSDTDATRPTTPSKQQPCACPPPLDLIYQLITTSLPPHPLTQKQFYTQLELHQLSDNQLSKLVLPPTVLLQNDEEDSDDSVNSTITVYRSAASTGALHREQLPSSPSSSSETVIDLFNSYTTAPPVTLDKRVHECLVEHEFEAQRRRDLQQQLASHPPKCPNKARMIGSVVNEEDNQQSMQVKMVPKCLWQQMSEQLSQLSGTTVIQATQPTAVPPSATARHHHTAQHSHTNTPLTVTYNTAQPIEQQLHLECKTRQLSRPEIERVGLVTQNLITHCNAVLPYMKQNDGIQAKPTVQYMKLHLLLNINNELVLQYASALRVTTFDVATQQMRCFHCNGLIGPTAENLAVRQLQLPCNCAVPKSHSSPKRKSTTVWSTASIVATKHAKLQAAEKQKQLEAQKLQRPKTALQRIATVHDTSSLSKMLQKQTKLSDDARELLHWKLIVAHRVSIGRTSIMPQSQSVKQLHKQHTASSPNLHSNGQLRTTSHSDERASALSANRHARLKAQKTIDQTNLSSIIAKRLLQPPHRAAKTRPSSAAPAIPASADE